LERLDGPLLDRIDLYIEVPRLRPQELMNREPGETSLAVQERVLRGRRKQATRWETVGITCNAQIETMHLPLCALDNAARSLLNVAIEQFSLSAVTYGHILKIARTIADLDDSEVIQLHHAAEAVNYRTLV
jgi:magnesium chelatase family protein